MLRHIEKAYVFCTWREVMLIFDDGKMFAENDPKIRKFTRRKRKVVKIRAYFTMAVTIGKFTDIIPEPWLNNAVIIDVRDNTEPRYDILDRKRNELIKTLVYDVAKKEPIQIIFNGGTLKEVYWLFEDKFYKDTDGLAHDDVKAIIETRKRMRRARINRAKTLASTPDLPAEGMRRGLIPDDVKLLVWTRDGGKCAKCGSRQELQYDHVIPFSLGGSSSEDNLQILCGPCNRAKSNSIA